MKNKNDATLKFIQKWIDSEFHDFPHPIRRGTPKGQTIGLFENKRRAAFLMVLYPHLKLCFISKASKIDLSVLRVWRTQPVFRKEIQTACDRLVQTIHLIVENYLAGLKGCSRDEADKIYKKIFVHVDRLPCFAESVSKPLMAGWIDKLKGGSLEYAPLVLRNYFNRAAIEAGIDQLTNPETWEKYGVEKMEDLADLLKNNLSLLKAEV
jgi:hypothetical protein